jgi:hypothetical protein
VADPNLIFQTRSRNGIIQNFTSGIHQDDRSLELSLGNLPVRAEQSISLFCGDQAETVPLVKADGPLSGSPSAD